MSIYDDEGAANPGDIYSGGDELVVPDWDVAKGAPTAPGGKPAKSGGGPSTDHPPPGASTPRALLPGAASARGWLGPRPERAPSLPARGMPVRRQLCAFWALLAFSREAETRAEPRAGSSAEQARASRRQSGARGRAVQCNAVTACHWTRLAAACGVQGLTGVSLGQVAATRSCSAGRRRAWAPSRSFPSSCESPPCPESPRQPVPQTE